MLEAPLLVVLSYGRRISTPRCGQRSKLTRPHLNQETKLVNQETKLGVTIICFPRLGAAMGERC